MLLFEEFRGMGMNTPQVLEALAEWGEGGAKAPDVPTVSDDAVVAVDNNQSLAELEKLMMGAKKR